MLAMSPSGISGDLPTDNTPDPDGYDTGITEAEADIRANLFNDDASDLPGRPVGDQISVPSDLLDRGITDTPPDASVDHATDTDDSDSSQEAGAGELARVLDRLDEVARLASDLRTELSEAVNRFPDCDEQRARAEEIRQEVRDLRETVTTMAGRGAGQDPDLASAAAAQSAALVSDVRDARRRFRANAAWKRLWDAVKRVAPQLWALITRLVRVKEWSVTGQLGAGALGFASAGITVTFG
jgi:hypothetical protein